MSNLKEYAKRTLKEVGISEGQTVLDCCCGEGTYTIPAAELVGEKWLIYAIDRSDSKLGELKKKLKSKRLQNIKIKETNVRGGITLPHKVDVVLLYDVFWYFEPRKSDTLQLMKNIFKLVKKGD